MTGVGEKQKTGTEPTVAKSEFRIRKEVFCAASLWTRAISSYWTPNYEEGQASQGLAPNHDALNQVWFDDSCVSVPQLSFWFALYTLKQLIVMPGFLAKDLKTRGYSCPPHWRKNVADFDREIKEAVGTKNAADGISHDDVGQVIGPPGDAEWWKSVSANLKGESIPEWKTNAECFRGKFTEKINELRDAMKLSPLKSEELFHSSILKGPDAVWQLRAAALQGVRTDVFASTARSPYYAIYIGRDEMGWLKEPDSLGGQQFKFVIVGTDDKRRLNLNDVSEFLFGHAGHQLIVNCHATGMRGGLSALATELFQPKYREQHGCDLPMLYIPLHGRGLDTPDDNLDGLTMRVHSFYAERLADKEPARGLLCASDSSRQAELICQIRKLMAQYPAIIVFDGYRSPQRTAVADNYPLNTLRAAIADDQLFDLIEQLVMIPTPQITPDGSGIIDVGRFKQNRFLITSDFPLFCDDEREDGRMVPLHPHPLLNFVNGKSFNIAMPASASIPDILPSFGNQAPSQIRLIREQIGGEDHVDMEQ